jgi:hypothetical protein
MDALIDLFMVLVLHWRLGLSVFGSTALAIFLAAALPWFTGAFGLALVVVSVGVGLLWEGAADESRVERIASGKGKR